MGRGKEGSEEGEGEGEEKGKEKNNPFNPFSLSDYRRPSSTSITNFRQILQQAGYTVTVRTTRADDIGAACGQLVGDVADQTKRSSRHLAKHSANIIAASSDQARAADSA